MAKKDTRQINHLDRLRKACGAMPECEEKLSHGEPAFFVRKKLFAMFADNHHGDGHVAVWLPAAPGVQPEMIGDAPETFFRPPYVGCRGWIGVELGRIGDDELLALVRTAWRIVAPKKLPGIH